MALLRKLVDYKTKPNVDEVNSIIDNLHIILNTKRGYGFFLQNFGLSDYHHLNSREDIAKMMVREISENIALFEPRLTLVKVKAIKDSKVARLSFHIDCQIRESAYSLKLFLDPTRKQYQVEL
jgi:type VI secretion system lysozyme-like protein